MSGLRNLILVSICLSLGLNAWAQKPHPGLHLSQSGSERLGSETLSLHFTTTTDCSHVRGQYMSTFIELGCLPTPHHDGPQSRCTVVRSHMENKLSLFNILLGIQDPVDFVPPFFCKGVLQEETGEAGDFFSALQSLAK